MNLSQDEKEAVARPDQTLDCNLFAIKAYFSTFDLERLISTNKQKTKGYK